MFANPSQAMFQLNVIGVRLHSLWRIKDMLVSGDVDLTLH